MYSPQIYVCVYYWRRSYTKASGPEELSGSPASWKMIYCLERQWSSGRQFAPQNSRFFNVEYPFPIFCLHIYVIASDRRYGLVKNKMQSACRLGVARGGAKWIVDTRRDSFYFPPKNEIKKSLKVVRFAPRSRGSINGNAHIELESKEVHVSSNDFSVRACSLTFRRREVTWDY